MRHKYNQNELDPAKIKQLVGMGFKWSVATGRKSKRLDPPPAKRKKEFRIRTVREVLEEDAKAKKEANQL